MEFIGNALSLAGSPSVASFERAVKCSTAAQWPSLCEFVAAPPVSRPHAAAVAAACHWPLCRPFAATVEALSLSLCVLVLCCGRSVGALRGAQCYVMGANLRGRAAVEPSKFIQPDATRIGSHVRACERASSRRRNEAAIASCTQR